MQFENKFDCIFFQEPYSEAYGPSHVGPKTGQKTAKKFPGLIIG